MQLWQEVAAKKQKQRDDSIPSEWKIPPVPKEKKNVTDVVKESNILSNEELEIIGMYDVTALAAAIAEEKFSALQVTTAYCKAAAISQQVANVVTEIFFDKAIERAKELDDYQKRTGKVVGPFHGIPVSVKDYINIKDVDTTGGYIGYSSLVSGRKHSENAPMIDVLLKAGAVLYVKTQNPQTLMCLDGDNNVYGPTYNPWNRDLTSGGSSSGEGGLIALNGSPIGIGSDIGGSVRGPAGFCGIYGFKPSCERLSCSGTEHSFHGQENIKATLGPMGRSVRDMELFMKTMIGDEPWLYDDPNIWPLAWKPVDLGDRKLTIGIMKNDGVVHPHPPIARALEYAEKALKAAGHEVIDYEPYKHQEAWDLIYPMYFPDGAHSCFEAMALSGEPICSNPAKFIGTSKQIIPQSITKYMEVSISKMIILRESNNYRWLTIREYYRLKHLSISTTLRREQHLENQLTSFFLQYQLVFRTLMVIFLGGAIHLIGTCKIIQVSRFPQV